MKLQSDKSQIPANAPLPGLYRHYKGSRYQVLGMARHSETEEWLVVYQALYAERGFWVRPLSIWLDPVTVSTGEAEDSSLENTVIRFELIEQNMNSLSAITEPG